MCLRAETNLWEGSKRNCTLIRLIRESYKDAVSIISSFMENLSLIMRGRAEKVEWGGRLLVAIDIYSFYRIL